MICPRCSSVLSPVTYDSVEVQVCPECKGEWLSSGELYKILEHHDEIFTEEEINSMEAVNKEIFTAEQDDHDELNCPNCKGIFMEHFNYGDTSGIILHKCLQCEGIWADKDQLQKLEMLVDGWKESLAADTEKYGPLLKKIELKEQQDIDKSVSVSKVGFVNAILRRFCE
jgi:Zn-finger nucleic acid-binding protein